MLEPERQQQTTDCPACGKDLPVTWFGKVNNVHFCGECKLMKIVKQDNSEANSKEKR